MKKLFAVLFVTVALLVGCVCHPAYADEVKAPEVVVNTEMLYLPNAVGGFVVLDAKDCKYEPLRAKGFVGEAYVSNSVDDRIYGCWYAPTFDDKDKPEDPRFQAIVTVVIFYNDVPYVQEYLSSDFSPEKKRLEEVAEPEVKENKF
jgi:hypothetical protein